jgi:hypothetical protein
MWTSTASLKPAISGGDYGSDVERARRMLVCVR